MTPPPSHQLNSAIGFHHGLVSPNTPLLPSSEAALIHFTTHLSNTVSYGTIKFYLAAVKNLHTEFGFPLDFSSKFDPHTHLSSSDSFLP